MTRLVGITLVLIVGPAAAQTAPPAIFLPPVVPPGLKVLTQPAVQTDVGLTAAQRTEIGTLNDLWGQSPQAWEPLSAVWVTPDMVRAVIARRTQEFLAKSLTKEQRARLDQIVFQLREKEFGAHTAFAMAAGDLGLRADQLEDVQNLKGLRVEEILKHVVSGDRYEKIKDKVAATNGETFEKMAEMLTRTQRERLKELRGRPFDARSIEGVDDQTARRNPTYPAELFGVYDFELRYLESDRIRSDIGLTRDQAVALSKPLVSWEEEYLRLEGDRFVKVAALHDRTTKVLGEVLPAEQRKRFDALMARRRAAVGGPEAACGYPPVVTELKLSPVQLDKLRTGKLAADVLSKDQAHRLDRLLATPFPAVEVNDPVRKKKVPPQPQPEPEAAFARAFLALSNRLKLSEEQIKKLRELAEDEPKVKDLIRRELSLAETPPVAGAGRGLTVDRAVMDKYQAAVEEQCWHVLDAPQQSLARKIFGRGR